MIASEQIAETIAERWLARTLESYPPAARISLSSDHDSFRNPVGNLLRENLRVLVRELLGDMNREAVSAALDAIIRLRAVQGFIPSEALRFLLELREALAEVCGSCSASMQARIDDLALMGFNQYVSCREQISALRAKEAAFRARCAAEPE
jgi:hypothetical protein